MALLAGAIIAFVIGSGFATGQEIIQYFTAYGLGGIAVILVFAVTFIYYNVNFAKAGAEEHFERANDVYKFYCGKYLGTFFDYYSTVFCYMSFFVMVGGAASTLNQQYGLAPWIGGVLMCAIVVLIVSGGLKRLVDVIGVLGPIKIAFFLFIAIATLVMTWQAVPEGLAIIDAGAFVGATEDNTIKTAGDNWLISGLSYAGFVLLWFASFMAALGAKENRHDLYKGIVVATMVLCITIGLISFAQIANINVTGEDGASYVWNANIPNLILAYRIWPPLATIFSIIVFIGICAAAVPLLYNPASRFSQEGTPRFRVLTVVFGVVGLIIGLFLPYRDLVNIIYVLNGYIGAVLLIFMIVRNIRDLARARKAPRARNMHGH